MRDAYRTTKCFGVIAILVGVLIMILLVGTAEALEWHQRCLNSTHIFKETNIQMKKGSTVYRYDLNDTTECEHGCDTKNDMCNPPPTTQSWVTFGIFGAIAGMFYIIYRIVR